MNLRQNGLIAAIACFAIAGAGCSDRTSDNMAKTTPPAPSVAQPATNPTAPVAEVLDDTALTAKVKAALIAEPGLKSMPIDVTTTGAVVTLSGAVPSTADRTTAVQVAQAVQGVKSVVDNLAAKS